MSVHVGWFVSVVLWYLKFSTFTKVLLVEDSGFLGCFAGFVFVMFWRSITCSSSRVELWPDTLQSTNPVTQCCIPEDLNLHWHCFGILKSQFIGYLLCCLLSCILVMRHECTLSFLSIYVLDQPAYNHTYSVFVFLYGIYIFTQSINIIIVSQILKCPIWLQDHLVSFDLPSVILFISVQNQWWWSISLLQAILNRKIWEQIFVCPGFVVGLI
jgi:hypothetical protein